MIRRAAYLTIVLAALAAILLPVEASAGRPIVLVFEPKAGEGANRTLVTSTARALRDYLRETQKVEATVFNRESPAITRAILENRLTADQVASYASDQEKTKVAEVLAYDYACGSEISLKESTVTVKVWVAKTGGGKGDRWEATGATAASGNADTATDNAMQSAASSAIHNLARRAFTDLPLVAQAEPVKGNESTAINADQPPVQVTKSSDDYVAEADRNLKMGNIALAIQQYSRAVDADPTKPGLRVKLAEAYMARGMYEESESELARAEKAGAAADTLAAVRDKLAKLRGGSDLSEPVAKDNAKNTGTSVVVSSGDPALAKIVEGDKLWNDGKPDEAATAYKESTKLNPREWRAWERLAIVNASMALFAESRKALDELKRTQPTPEPKILENRYDMLRRAFDTHFNSLLTHYDTSARSFANGALTREAYYSDSNGLALRLESMAKFLDAIDVPPAKKAANTHRSLACGLMAQAASSLTEYLETNDKAARDNAATFLAAARKELEQATKLDGNTIQIEKPAPPQ
jgi:tetratricopeptide (TPR) repeat protein